LDILPKFQFNTGVYYRNILFENNLNLKTGISFTYNHYTRQPEFNYYNLFSPNVALLNFEVAGEIQKKAMLYFRWENLTGENYFIVPFYPMPGRSIRFGVAWNFLN